MKKLLALLLSLVMVLAFAACGEKANQAGENEGESAMTDIKVGFIFLHDENSTYDPQCLLNPPAKLYSHTAYFLFPEVL